MASETTFDNWKVVFWWGKARKTRFSQNPLNSRFSFFGFLIYTLSCAKLKKIHRDKFCESHSMFLPLVTFNKKKMGTLCAGTIKKLAQSMRWNCPVSASNSLAGKKQALFRQLSGRPLALVVNLQNWEHFLSHSLLLYWSNKLCFIYFHPVRIPAPVLSKVHFSFVSFC